MVTFMRNRLSQESFDYSLSMPNHVVRWFFNQLHQFSKEGDNTTPRSRAMFKYGLLGGSEHSFASVLSEEENIEFKKEVFNDADGKSSERFYYLGVYFYAMYSELILPFYNLCEKGELDWLRVPSERLEICQMSVLEHYLTLESRNNNHLSLCPSSMMGAEQSSFFKSNGFVQSFDEILRQLALIKGDLSGAELVNLFYLFGLIEGLALPFHRPSQLCLHVLGKDFLTAAHQFFTIKQDKYPGDLGKKTISYANSVIEFNSLNQSYHQGVSHRSALNPYQVKTLFPYRAPVNQNVLSLALNRVSALVLISLVFPSNAFESVHLTRDSGPSSHSTDEEEADSCFNIFGN